MYFFEDLVRVENRDEVRFSFETGNSVIDIQKMFQYKIHEYHENRLIHGNRDGVRRTKILTNSYAVSVSFVCVCEFYLLPRRNEKQKKEKNYY
jgi:hypothetical protein